MESVRIAEKLTKEEARDAIDLAIQRFNATFTYVQDDPRFHLYNESFIKVVHKLDNDNYYLKASQYLLGEDFKRLGAKGLTEFLLKLKVVSEKFGLHVAIPQNVKVIEDDVVQKFIENLTTSALIGINHNITELGDLKEDLIKQAEHIDLKKPVDRMTQLELCILKKKEYIDGCYQRPDLIQRQNGLLENGYVDEHNAIQAKLDAISQIPKDYPLIQFLTGTTDYSSVTNQIEKAVKTVSNAQTKIKNMILDGSFPVWELDQTVLAERNKITDSKELQTVDEWLKKCKTDKKIKDLLMTLVPIGLTLITFFIPGGASLLLLGMRAGAQVLNASFGVVSAVSDIKDGYIEIVKSNADIKLSKEQIDLLEAQGKDAAVFQFFAVLISAGFITFDVKDAAKAISLYNKADNIGAVARARLRKCQKLGANQLQECSENGLRFIGKIENEENAVYILNMGNNVVDAIGKSSKKVLADNLSKLSVDQLPKAFNFFPNNLNTNIIWLGMDNVDAETVLNCSDFVCNKYNSIVKNTDYAVTFSDKAKDVEIKLNNLLHSTDKNLSFKPSEKIALLKETLPPAEKIKPRTSFIRVQTGQRKTFAQQSKPFAWVTDPYILAGNDLPNDFLHSVGFPETSMKTGANDKIWLDLVVFKDVDTTKKFIPDEVIDWKRITEELENGINNANIDQINDLRITIPDLITKDNAFNRKLFEEKYLDYFMTQHVPGTKYSTEYAELGNYIYDYTGASDLFTGSGVTASANGIENIERGFNNYKDFEISEIRDYKNIKIFRFEVVNDISQKIKRVYVKEVK